MKWWKNIFNYIRRKEKNSMADFRFIPRDDKTGKIDISRVTEAYVLKTSDGTKIAIAIKIDGIWYSFPYDASLDAELANILGGDYSEMLIDEWARFRSEYSSIIYEIEQKIHREKPKPATGLGINEK